MTAPRVQRFDPADLWEQKVDEGMSEEEATAFVRQAMQEQGSPDFSDVESGSSSRASAPRGGIGEAYKRAGRLAGTALQGAAFGAGDEIVGAASAIPDVVRGTGKAGETYRTNRDLVRAQLDRASRDNPKAAVAAEIGGALLSPVTKALLPAKGAMTVGRTMLQGAKGGAAGGALYGAASEDGSAGDRLAAGAGGAVIGGAGGALTPLVSQLASKIGRGARALSRGPSGQVAADASPRAAARAARAGADDIAEAEQHVMRGLARDKVPLESLGDLPPDDPRMLLNMGGRSTRTLARAAQSIPSEATDEVQRAVYTQLEQGPDRLLRDVSKSIKKPIPNPGARYDELAGEAAKAAKPFYDPLRNEFVSTPEIAAVARRPVIRKAIDQARANLLDSGENVPDGTTVGLLDDVKKILDDEIEKIDELVKVKRAGKYKSRAVALNKARDDLVAAVDDATGGRYAKAREVAGEGIRKREAFKEGTKYATAHRNKLETEIPALSPDEQALYREGAATSMEDVISKTGDRRNLATRLFGSNAERQKLATAFKGDPEALDVLQTAFSREDALRQQATEALISGQSMTTPVREAIDEVRGTMLEDLARRGLMSTARRRVVEAYLKATMGGEGVANEIGRLVTSRPNQALMERLLKSRSDALATSARRAAKGAKVGTVGGAATSMATR